MNRWWDQVRHDRRTLAETWLPLVAKTGAEQAVLTLSHDPVLATAGGEAAATLTQSVVQRLFHRTDPVVPTVGRVVVAPVPSTTMTPGYFVYTVPAERQPDQSLRVGTQVAPSSPYPHYFAAPLPAWEFAQSLAATGEVDMVSADAVDPLTTQAWALWLAQRQQDPFPDDWYLRLTPYHIGPVTADGVTGFCVWQRALTSTGVLYFVLDRAGMMDPYHDPWVAPTRTAAQKALQQQLPETSIPWAAIDTVPAELQAQLRVTVEAPGGALHVRRVAPVPQRWGLTVPVPLGTPLPLKTPGPVDTHPAVYVSGVQLRGQAPFYFAWTPAPETPWTPEGWPARIQLVTDPADPARLLTWPQRSAALQFFAHHGVWAQMHPQWAPIKPLQPFMTPASVTPTPSAHARHGTPHL